jgi:NAD(P)-dependent dehydrogenase (short-subunit alcohol dehydrogenase family)
MSRALLLLACVLPAHAGVVIRVRTAPSPEIVQLSALAGTLSAPGIQPLTTASPLTGLEPGQQAVVLALAERARVLVAASAPSALSPLPAPLVPAALTPASPAAFAPVPGLSLYAASKFAVRGFSLAAAQELRRHGVFVTVVCPDAVRTPMLALQRDYPEAALTFSGPRTLGVEAQITLRMTATKIAYTTPQGAPYAPLDPGVHHRNETIAGIGDPWLLASAGTLLGRWIVQGRIGTSIPAGRAEPNPFALGEMGKPHQHIQFGNGTFDPLVVADVARKIGALDLGRIMVALRERLPEDSIIALDAGNFSCWPMRFLTWRRPRTQPKSPFPLRPRTSMNSIG